MAGGVDSMNNSINTLVAVWAFKGYGIRDLLNALEKGDSLKAVQALSFYGPPDLEEFSDWIRVGEAEVTLHLVSRDEQVSLAVQALQNQLAEERVKWHERQEAILAEISKLSAIEYVAEASS